MLNSSKLFKDNKKRLSKLQFNWYILLMFVLVGFGSCFSEKQLVDKVKISINPSTNPWTHLNFQNNPHDFQFAVVSDRTGGVRPGVFKKAVKKLNLLQPEFVISVGDLIPGFDRKNDVLDQQWMEFDEIVEQLEMPFFYVPGNHDIFNETATEKWIQRYGRSYYHFVYKNVLFLCLNTEDPPSSHISNRQIEYISKTLEENHDVRWTLLFLHKPFWDYYATETNWEEVESLLNGRQYTVFAGHLHRYRKCIRNDQRYLTLATTGGGSDLLGPRFGSFDHIVWVTMTAEGPRIANLSLDGIHDENVAMLSSFTREEVLKTAPIFNEQSLFEKTSTQIQIKNDQEFPLKMRIIFKKNIHVRPISEILERVLEPHSEEQVKIEIVASDQPVPVYKIAPLVLYWSGVFKIPDKHDVEVDGTGRIVFNRLLQVTQSNTSIAVDGRLDEWESMPFVCEKPSLIQNGKGNLDSSSWDGPNDSSFRFNVSYDDNYIYIIVKVIDDKIISVPTGEPWAQDGIEVRVDARPHFKQSIGRGRSGKNMKNFPVIMLGLGEKTKEMVLNRQDLLPTETQAVCLKTDFGYVSEIAFPVSYLNEHGGKQWDTFRLNIAVNDYDDPDDNGSRIWWHPDWRTSQNHPGSGTFKRRE